MKLRVNRTISALVMGLGLSVGLVACDKKEPNPTVEQAQNIADKAKVEAEKAGEKIEAAAEKAGEKLEAAADKAKEVAGNAAEAAGEKLEAAKEAVGNAAEAAGEKLEAAGEKLEAAGEKLEAAGEKLEAAVAEAKEAIAGATATLGQAAPDFVLKDLKGNEVKLSDYRGKIVVLEWFNPECPFVVRQYQTGALKDQAKNLADNVVWLNINSNAAGKQGAGAELNAAKATEYGINHAILLDEAGTVGRLYQARNTPHMYIINTDGTLVYAGAIDNAPSGEAPAEGYVNYVAEALKALAEGKPVAISETKAYGCSVKYAD